MNDREYIKQLEYNQQRITTLQADKYPSLYRFLFGYGQRKLKVLIYLLELAKADTHTYKSDFCNYTMLSLRQLATQQDTPTKDIKQIWHYMVLFECMGLITRIQRKTKISDEYRKQHRDQHTQYQFGFTEYTDKKLLFFEQQAELWNKSGASIRHISKSTLADIFGQATANKTYKDKRTKPARTAQKEKALIQSIKHLTAEGQPTTKDRILKHVIATTSVFSKPTDTGTEQAYNRAKRTLESNKGFILEQANATTRTATKEEIELYKLHGRIKIIVLNTAKCD